MGSFLCRPDQTFKTSNRPGKKSQGPVVFVKLAPAQPTEVYDTYWRFAAERQRVFFRRLAGLSFPWTQDPILQVHKFTNAYRASDRVSQFLIKKVIYASDYSPEDIVFRILVFKTFNKIETWKALEEGVGTIRLSRFDVARYDEILRQVLAKGSSIYSGAYMMASGQSFYGRSRKHSNHLLMIADMMKAKLGGKVAKAKSMREVFDLLLDYPTIGYFLAYQYAIDLNYSELTDFCEMDFVVPGPGARDGIRKCFSSLGGLSEADIIKLMADRQEVEFERLGLDFKSLGGRRLQLIDCQNLFCETDKYARVAHPEVKGVSARTRIKQKFAKGKELDDPWYPPKWKINPLVNASIHELRPIPGRGAQD